jgi:tRNA dimethylallyltransferase
MAAVPENAGLREQLAGEEMELLRQRLLELRPETHNSTDLTEKSRLIRAIEIAQYSKAHPAEGETASLLPLVIGISCPREELRRRITARLQARLKAGMVEEVRRLHDLGLAWQRLEAFGLEYRYIAWHLQGKMAEQEMFETLNTRIHQFAKRQETWFRGMEKKGVPIHWIDGADEAAALRVLTGPAE